MATPRQAHKAEVRARKQQERFARSVLKDRRRRKSDLWVAVNPRENPNKGKQNAARQIDAAAEQRIRDARRDYRPLTVKTPVLQTRRNVATKRTTQYTV